MTTLFDLDEPQPPRSSEPPVPYWIAAYETRTGSPPALAGIRAIPRPCRKCGQWTLTGYDDYLLAALATTDPNPLTPQLEAAALILGRPTWELRGTPGRYSHRRRTPFYGHIRKLKPANQCTVVAQHNCAGPLSTATLPLTDPRMTFPENPPF